MCLYITILCSVDVRLFVVREQIGNQILYNINALNNKDLGHDRQFEKLLALSKICAAFIRMFGISLSYVYNVCFVAFIGGIP